MCTFGIQKALHPYKPFCAPSWFYLQELKIFTLAFFSTAERKYSVLGSLITDISKSPTVRHTHTE